MKIHSLTILHYGKDYLSYALRSVYHSVDQCHVFYTPTPSHGHSTNVPPVETKEELQAAAYAYDPDDKVKWYDMLGVTQEGPQRDLALKTVEAAGADIVLVVDCDEIWPKIVLKVSLNCVQYFSPHRNNLVNMGHLWRSFDWICYDQGWPVRFINLTKPEPKAGEAEYLPAGGPFHFGYAVTDKVMQYKWQIHGHKNELRSNWLTNIWPVWPPTLPVNLAQKCKDVVYAPDGTFIGDALFDNKSYKEILNHANIDISVHPTNDQNFWMPEPFDKAQLPVFMAEHPFWGLEKIE